MEKFEIIKSYKTFLEAYRLDSMDKMYYNLWDKEIAEEELKKENTKREKSRENRNRKKEFEEKDEPTVLTFEKYIEVLDDKTDKMKKIKVPDVSDNIPTTNLSAVFPMTTTTTISGSSVPLPLK